MAKSEFIAIVKDAIYLKQATAKDPVDPAAHAALATAYVILAHERSPEAYPLARASAQRALAWQH